MKKIDTITKEQIKAMGVQSLPTCPNSTSLYGTEGLSPKELQYRFDRLAYLLADKINALIGVLKDGTLGDYVPLHYAAEGITSLSLLLNALPNGDVAKLLCVRESVVNESTYPLQTILYRIFGKISVLEETLRELPGHQTSTVYSIDLPIDAEAWTQNENGRYLLTRNIEGLTQQDVIIPSLSNDDLWGDIQIQEKENAIDISLSHTPSEVSTLKVIVIKTREGGALV